MPHKILIPTEEVVINKLHLKFKILDMKSLDIKNMTEVLTYYVFI